MLCYAFNLLMAFDRLLLKGLLTYLLTYLLNRDNIPVQYTVKHLKLCSVSANLCQAV